MESTWKTARHPISRSRSPIPFLSSRVSFELERRDAWDDRSSPLAVGFLRIAPPAVSCSPRHLVQLVPTVCLWTTSGRRTARVQYPEFDVHSRLHSIPVPQRLSHSRRPPVATSCCTTRSAVSSTETSRLLSDALSRSCLRIWCLYVEIALLRVRHRPKPSIQKADEFRVLPPDRNTETACK